MTKQEFVTHLTTLIKEADYYVGQNENEVIYFELDDGTVVSIELLEG